MTPPPTTLARYVGRHFLAAFLVAALAVGALLYLLEAAELLRRAARDQSASFAAILGMAALKTPSVAEHMIPFSVMFGAVGAFFRLGRSSEITAARAGGMSIWQFAAAPMIAALGVGVIMATLYNPIAASLHEEFRIQEARRFSGGSGVLTVTEGGVWLRQGDVDGELAINARVMRDEGRAFDDVIVIMFDATGRFSGRIDARTAVLERGRWRLDDGWRSGVGSENAHFDAAFLPTSLSAADILEGFAPPDSLSFWQLPRFIETLEAAGFSANRHRLRWHALIALPGLLAAMVALAAAFSIRPHRLGGVGRSIGAAALSAAAIFFITDLTRAIGLAGAIPAVVAAWTPTAAVAMLAAAALAHVEDG